MAQWVSCKEFGIWRLHNLPKLRRSLGRREWLNRNLSLDTKIKKVCGYRLKVLVNDPTNNGSGCYSYQEKVRPWDWPFGSGSPISLWRDLVHAIYVSANESEDRTLAGYSSIMVTGSYLQCRTFRSQAHSRAFAQNRRFNIRERHSVIDVPRGQKCISRRTTLLQYKM